MSDVTREPPRRLTALPIALEAAGYEPEPPRYRTLHQHAINGVIPAVQIRNIWHFRPRDLPVIAEVLGLKVRTPRPRSAADQTIAAA